jgi:hypothetical protein
LGLSNKLLTSVRKQFLAIIDYLFDKEYLVENEFKQYKATRFCNCRSVP